MPIIRLDMVAHTMRKSCLKCGAYVDIALSSLVLGVGVREESLDPNIFMAPQCPCGEREGYNRTFDVVASGNPIAGTQRDMHRRAVNTIAVYLKAQGHVNPTCATRLAAETSPPPDLITGNSIDIPEFQPPPGYRI